jgi:hypothetical protein
MSPFFVRLLRFASLLSAVQSVHGAALAAKRVAPVAPDAQGAGAMTTISLGSGAVVVLNTFPDTRRVEMSYALPVWLAFGRGSQMVGSRAVIGVDAVQNPSMPVVGVYFLAGEDSASRSVLAGSLGDHGIVNASFATDSNGALLSFTVNKGSDFAFVFTDSTVECILAVGPAPPYVEHTEYAVVPIAFESSTRTVTSALLVSTTMAAHICMALLAFCFLLPIGASVALFRAPQSKAWFPFHRGIQFVGALVGVFVVVPGAMNQVSRDIPAFSMAHHILGLTLVVAVLCQVLGGLLRPHAPALGQSASKPRLLWTWLHRLFALFILFGGPTNAILGIERITNWASGANFMLWPLGSVIAVSDFEIAVLVIAIVCMCFVGIALVYRAACSCKRRRSAAAAARLQPPIIPAHSAASYAANQGGVVEKAQEQQQHGLALV